LFFVPDDGEYGCPALQARGTTSLTVQWERIPSSGALGPFYHLQFRRVDDCEWSSLGKVQGTMLKKDGLEPGVEYVFRIKPTGKEGEGWSWSPNSLQLISADGSALASPPFQMDAKELSGQFVREFVGVDTSKLTEYLDQCPAPFAPSLVYEVATEQKLLDESQRISMFRTMTDPVLFDICKNILQSLTSSDPFSVFTLHENDVT